MRIAGQSTSPFAKALAWVQDKARLPRFSDLPLGFQLFHGFAVVVLALAALGVFAYRSAQNERVAANAAVAELAEHELVDSAFTDLVSMESAYRGFLASGKEEYLAPYAAAANTFPGKLARLESLPTNSPAELRLWQQLDQLVREWDHDVLQPGIEARRAFGNDLDASGDGVLVDNLAQDDARFGAIRQWMGRANELGQADQVRFINAANAASQQVRQVLIWGTAGAAVLSLVVAFLLARSIVTSMATLVRTSDAIQRGHFGRRTGLRRKDEIGQASTAFDRMAEQMQATLSERELRAETEAQERAVLALILNSMNEAVYEVDVNGRFRRANQGTARLTGHPADSLIGRRADEVLRVEDEGGRLLEDDEYAYRKALETGKQQESANTYLRKPDGKRVPIAVTATPILDTHGEAVAAVQVVRDISRETETNKMKDQIISLVSHELRTPIGHIKGFASSLLAPDIAWDPSTIHDFIIEIDKEVDRLSALVADILDISRIESGRSLQLESLRPAALASRALKAMQKMTSEHTVLNDVHDDLPEISVDASQLERVLCNLVENAAKYSPAGTEIRVSAHANGEEIEWCVEDHGEGVPYEYRERIFEKFFRAPTASRRAPGTGLGLPICRGIIEAHGGRLWFEDRPGGGSRFCFTIGMPEVSAITSQESRPTSELTIAN